MVKVALVQASPFLFNREKTLEKALHYIKQAGQEEADVVIFPETFIPGYPRGLSFGFLVGSRSQSGREDYLRYYNSAVPVPGEETEKLAEAAGANEVYVVMGVTEQGERQSDALKDHTLYCSLLYFGPEGEYLGKHQKLKPTGSERLIWGEGDGRTLTTVQTPYGVLGGLICWENYMPLARMAMFQSGVTLYAAPTADARESWQATIRHIAMEGRCFVLACNQFMTKDLYPEDLHYNHELADQPEIICPGGTAIVDPMGEYVAGPVYNREEMLVAELDMDQVIKGKMDFDVSGHYHRPDVFDLRVHRGH